MSEFPMLYKVKQHFERPVIESVEQEIHKAVERALENAHLPKGARIAVTAGSRGIQNIVQILKTTIDQLKQRGFSPFLVAAMGSHGRGESDGQKEVLDSLGITESAMGVPVSCSSEVFKIGETDHDPTQPHLSALPVYMAEEAIQADGIFVVNRIKTHTSFKGDYESGLLKMIAVGLGRAKGATMVHRLGAENLAKVIPAIAKTAMAKTNVLGGIAIVENAYEETAIIKGIPVERFFEEEKELLMTSKKLMPALPITEADLCLVGEMGKNFSGTGMDTNIIGRLRIEGLPELEKPNFKYLGVLRLSGPSHGNANGVGLADFTTETLANAIDRKATYLNAMTSGFVIRAAIPMTFQNDQELLRGALKALKLTDPESLKLIYIKNTLQIDEIWVSSALHHLVQDQVNITVEGGPHPIQFDDEGTLLIN